jgi:hypothetical protein
MTVKSGQKRSKQACTCVYTAALGCTGQFSYKGRADNLEFSRAGADLGENRPAGRRGQTN